MASVLGGQEGLGDGLSGGRATGADAATTARFTAGTAALTELNCKAAPAIPPKVIPPTTTANLPMFIVARTTRKPQGSIRKQISFKYGVTNQARRAFSEVFAATLILLKSCMHRGPTLIESFSTLRDRGVLVQKGRHNMQHTEDIGCLTQRSQLDRLQELADGIARERVKALQSSDLLATIVLVIGRSGKESTWDLDHLPMAKPATEPAVQLSLDPDAALDNLVPTQAIMRILRDTAASAVALIAPVNATAAALQLADIDHEQSLTARIDRQPDREPSLGQWDFGKVAWSVRLRHVLRAARGSEAEEQAQQGSVRPQMASAPARPADPAAIRRNHRREMREQLHRQPAAAPSWLQ